VVYLAVTSGRRYREKQLALREAELRGLESQINPHFLFNSLNSIRGLVLENPPLAQDLITRLANILRYNLHRDAGHTVPLASEVEAAADYLALESARYEERLRVRFDVAPETRSLPVPPMLLQTLVENAVKHGIATLPSGGELAVSSALEGGSLVLKVENPGCLAEPDPGRPRLGLENIRQRLRILYGTRAALHLSNGDGRVTATVRIPEDR
jgi:two-component system, LytTR family, sensor kinase